jgi:hypothetical protein
LLWAKSKATSVSYLKPVRGDRIWSWPLRIFRERKLSKELLRERLDYDPLTGIFKWRPRCNYPDNWNTKYAGKPAGYLSGKGYILIRLTINGERGSYLASRLAFIYMVGECPPLVDHKDRNRQNDRWENLRGATRFENAHNSAMQSNNKSGFKGVDYRKERGKWRAMICVNRRPIHLGFFSSPEEAHAAYCAAAEKYHRDFACLGNKTAGENH